MNIRNIKNLIMFFALLPATAFGYGEGGIRDYILVGGRIIRSLIPLVAALALLFFFWRLAQFILKARENGDARIEARNVILWGVLALFIIASIWGIVYYIQSDLGIPNRLFIDTY